MAYSDEMLYECGETRTMDLKILWKMLRLMGAGFFRYLAAIILMSLALTGFDTVTAMLLKSMVARAQRYGSGSIFEGLAGEAVFCLLTGLALLAVYALAFYVYTMEAKKGGARMQKLVYAKCLRLPYAYYENTHSGELLSKAIFDCEMATGIYGSRFRRILMPFLMTCFYLIPMLWLSPQVTLCLFGASTALLVVNAAFVKPIKRVSGELSDTNVDLTEQMTNIISGMEQVKIFSLKDTMVARCIADNNRFRAKQGILNRMSAGLDSLNSFFELLGSLVFIALGVYLVGSGVTTVENLAAVYVLYGSMSWNLLQVGLYIPSMASYLVNAKRVFEFLDKEEEAERYARTDGENCSDNDMADKAVCMRKVSFAYDGREEVLKEFDLDIEKGKCVALKGESGKGKSTIAKPLLGLYPVRAAKLANAHEFIMALENGYETRAGERGNRLSGGQRQRIAIARAILKDAPLLILDEATSALDNRSEQLVNEALGRLMQGRTTLVIAHRASTLAYADQVVEI